MQKFILTLVLFTISAQTNGQAPTATEVKAAVVQNGYGAPSDVQIQNFIQGAKNMPKRQAAMMLAQAIHESGGLKATTEDGCLNKCADYRGSWDNDVNCRNENSGVRSGKCYCGRGYLQLSFCSNYQAISQALYKDNRLADNPEQVAQESIAWATSFAFWQETVLKNWQAGVSDGVRNGQFGSSTKAINGALECAPGGNRDLANRRFKVYSIVLKAFNINETPNPAGC